MSDLYNIRKLLNLSQAALASFCGTTQATVSRWEKGELQPDREQIAKIIIYAKSIGVDITPEDFFAEFQTEAA